MRGERTTKSSNGTLAATLLLTGLLAGGCDSKGTGGNGNGNGNPSTCSGTLSGTVNATITDCGFLWSNLGASAGLIACHSKKPNDTGAMVGSAAITIESVEAGSLANTWNLHGKASATLVAPPMVSSSGTVNVAIAF